jgi:hypothetical protein
MSPTRRPNGSPLRRKLARKPPINPTLQTKRNVIRPSVAAKNRRDSIPTNSSRPSARADNLCVSRRNKESSLNKRILSLE